MKTLYKAVNRAAHLLGAGRLAAWSYARWLRWWMKKDPELGYWRFAEEYLGAGEIQAEVGA